MDITRVLIINMLIIYGLNSNVCSIYAPDPGRLSFVHILYRHGDRTPINPYPNDPYKGHEYWPDGFGQLTKIGKQQQYELGQYLRKRYEHFLSASYSKDLFYIQSTDVDRTLMSALSNLAGLFPPTTAQVWNSDMPWQPIPVHTIPEKLDHILAAKRPCPLYDFTLKEYKRSKEYRKLNKHYKSLYNYLTIHSGKKIDSFTAVNNLYNVLFIENLYNLTLPKWTRKIFPEGDMKQISGRSFATKTNTKKLARLKVGFLLKDIFARFSNVTESTLSPNRKMWIYSGHDTTIGNVLNALGLFEYHTPPYAACIMFELRIKKGIPYVQIFYRNTTDLYPPALHIPNCGQLCPLKDLYRLYSSILPTEDFDNECKLYSLTMTYGDGVPKGSSTDFRMTFILFGIILSVTIAVGICRNIYRNSKRSLYIQIAP